MYTQVGDNNVYHFIELEKKYKSNANKDLYMEPVYLHGEAICGNCVDKSKVLSEELIEEVDFLGGIAAEAGSLKEGFQKDILQLIEDNNIDWVKSVDKRAYEDMVNSKYFLMSHKKGGQIVPIILRQKEKLISQYVSEISGNIIESLFSTFPQLKENLLVSVNEIRQKFKSGVEEVRKKLPEQVECFYVAEDITLSENLNPYIMYEGTVRVPDENTPKVEYYSEVEIDTGRMEEWIAGLDRLATSQFYQQDEGFVNKVMGTIERVLRKGLTG
jgi:hypothetical protein